MIKPFEITQDLVCKLVADQFPEHANLTIKSVERQGHDNRTYRLGKDMLIRMPIAQEYALKVDKEQELLPRLAPYLSLRIPVPIKMGVPSIYYPYPFSIYQWLEGTSLNLLTLTQEAIQQVAFDLAKFLKELQSITNVAGPLPGQHNWWRGDHIGVYDKGAREQIAKLAPIIDSHKAITLWENASQTKWTMPPVWIHGDFAIGNMLIQNDKLSAIIDFGGMALGDPACDLGIAWTFLSKQAREIFIKEMGLDEDTWLRARGWVLWKATYELCTINDINSSEALMHQSIIKIVTE